MSSKCTRIELCSPLKPLFIGIAKTNINANITMYSTKPACSIYVIEYKSTLLFALKFCDLLQLPSQNFEVLLTEAATPKDM